MNSTSSTNTLSRTGNSDLIRCQPIFDIFVDTIFCAFNHKPTIYQHNYAKSLARSIHTIKHHSNIQLERQDIEQQLVLYWLQWYKAWKSKPQHLTLRGYLIRRTLFEVPDWLRREARVVGYMVTEEQLTTEAEAVDLSLRWLCYQSKELDLTRYDRFLCYLRYLKGMSISEISEVVFRHRNMVSKDIVSMTSKLRSIYQCKSALKKITSEKS